LWKLALVQGQHARGFQAFVDVVGQIFGALRQAGSHLQTVAILQDFGLVSM
jgi:hypothetical protein